MAMFVIRKQTNGQYNFIFTSRKGDPVLTSINCKQKSDCKMILKAVLENIEVFTFTKKNPGPRKFLYRLSKGGLVLATSRTYTTELQVHKAVDYLLSRIPEAEVLDFSDDDHLFSD